MAYELNAVLRLKDELSPKLKRAVGGINNAKKAVDNVANSSSRMNTALAGAGTAFTRVSNVGGRAFRGLVSGSRSVLNSLFSLKSAIIGIGATYALVTKPLQLSSDAEQATIAFTTMLGSAENARRFIADLTEFANKTPFELPQIRDASKRLLAFGFSAESVIPMLTGLGNASAGLGLGKDGIDRLTIAIGQMQAKQKVSGEEMLQLTEAGIPAWDILAKKMKISTAEVMKLSERGLIPADKAIKTLIDGMNQRFPDMMDKQSKSLAGLWSTMKDTFDNQILVKWGDGIASALKPRFDRLTNWIDANGDTIDRWGRNLQTVSGDAADFLMRKFEGAGRYIREHFTGNADFQKLTTLEAKIGYVFEDINKSFDTWYSTGGSERIQSAVDSLVRFMGDALSSSVPAMAKIGSDLGAAVAKGMITGLEDVLADHPLLGAAIVAKVTPGPLPVKVIAGGATLIGGAALNQEKQSEKLDATISKTRAGLNESYKANPEATIKMLEMLSGEREPDGKHAGGLSYVPYNGYRAELHRGERVLTADQNDKYTNSGGVSSVGGVSIAKLADQIIIREEADIDRITNAMVVKIREAARAGA